MDNDERKQLLDTKTAPYQSLAGPPPPQVVQFHGQPIIAQLPQYGYIDRPRQPPDHVGIAMFSFICCFWPVGVIALIFAFRSRYKYIDGDYAGAVEYSNKARNWARIAIIVGVGFVLLYISAGALPNILNATSQQ